MHQFSKKKQEEKLFIFFTLINLEISCLLHYINEPFWLNENQLLYIFATIAQVTGALFGLTLAAYALIDDKLKKIGDTEETSFDYTNRIRTDSFENLILISILSILTIIFSLLVLSLYRNQNLEILIFFILETIFLFLQLLIEIYSFIKDANPNNIAARKEEEKELFDSEYSSQPNVNTRSFGSFITYYNMLEKSIKELAKALIPGKNNDTQLQILDSLDILRDHKIISQKCYAQINELRLYRNSLVHSTEDDKIVSSSLFEILEKIYQLFSSITTSLGNDKLYSSAIASLNAYIDTLPSNIDEELLCFFIKHKTATIQDIVASYKITHSIARRKVQKLTAYGYITKINAGKNTKFQLSDFLFHGSFSFDYSNNNGKYIVGVSELTFSTKWSKASDKIIYAYSDCDDIDCIARIKNADLSNITITNLLSYDYSSRVREIAIGDAAVWKNKSGHYLITLVTAIQDDTRGYDNDLLQAEYRII